jgi:ParB family transcriptional regulator, chromosome partitioning protein
MSERRRGLGRGLSALLPAESEPVRTLPVARLRPNRLQPRSDFDETGLEELASSIRTQGVLQPIVVTPLDSVNYTIIAGERRWRAAQRAGLESVPVVVREVADDRQLLELALVENVQRADLNPVEEAEAYQTLVASFGLGHEVIAQRVGRSRAAVSNALRLLRLPPAVLDLMRAGRLTAGQARPLLALEDPVEIVRLAARAAEEGLSARALEALAAGERGGTARPRKARAPEPNAAAAAEKLTRRLQTRVEIERRGRGGVIRIHYHNEEELMRLFDLLTDRSN